MNFTKNIIIILFLISIFIIPVNAYLSNANFECGNLSGWDVYTSNPTAIYGLTNTGLEEYGNYTLYSSGNTFGEQTIVYAGFDASGINTISFDHKSGGIYSGANLGTSPNSLDVYSEFYNSTIHDWSHTTINISEYNCMLYIGIWGYANSRTGYLDNIQFDTTISESFIQFENTPYNEYDNAIVNFSVEKIINDYSDKRIFLEIATPKITDPYYNYVAYELSDYTGYRGLAIEGKHPIYDAYHNCSAYIRAYELDMSNYETLLEIEEPVLTDNHTLLEYTGYDYPINKSYITGQSIGINVDIIEHIETDFLYWPDEHFLLHVDAFSNSNQGDREYEYHIEPIYWDADRYFIKHFSIQPFCCIDADFNATIESYITVYRLGNTTRLTPTIYTNMYVEGYIPENESGYIPPDIPEESEEPEISDPDPKPESDSDYPIRYDLPNGTYANQTVNVSWTGEYYNTIDSTVGGLCSPIYNFTGWTLSPINSLNNSIGEFNYYMNESFIQTTEDSSILYKSINTIYNAIHPKIRNVITYYLIWVVLLIILKKD
jgi:hypothetical protein